MYHTTMFIIYYYSSTMWANLTTRRATWGEYDARLTAVTAVTAVKQLLTLAREKLERKHWIPSEPLDASASRRGLLSPNKKDLINHRAGGVRAGRGGAGADNNKHAGGRLSPSSHFSARHVQRDSVTDGTEPGGRRARSAPRVYLLSSIIDL